MSNQIIVHKARTNTLVVRLGYDVSGDTFESEIRVEPNISSELIVAWTIAWVTDGTDGDLLLTLDDSVTAPIDVSGGYMDLKRTTGGEPIAVFDRPLEVLFQGSVTA